jgi:hypothetical protein
MRHPLKVFLVAVAFGEEPAVEVINGEPNTGFSESGLLTSDRLALPTDGSSSRQRVSPYSGFGESGKFARLYKMSIPITALLGVVPPQLGA